MPKKNELYEKELTGYELQQKSSKGPELSMKTVTKGTGHTLSRTLIQFPPCLSFGLSLVQEGHPGRSTGRSTDSTMCASDSPRLSVANSNLQPRHPHPCDKLSEEGNAQVLLSETVSSSFGV